MSATTSTATINVPAGKTYTIKAVGECFVDLVAGMLGAGYTTERLVNRSDDFGPYGADSVLAIRVISGTATYGEKGGAQTAAVGAPLTLSLTESQGATLVGSTGATGTIQRYSNTGALIETRAISTGTMEAVLANGGGQTVVITPSAGSVDAAVVNAVPLAMTKAAAANGATVQYPRGVPKGISYLSDTIPGVDLYAAGYGVAPRLFYDPRQAATSRNLGTFKNPYTDPRHVMRVMKGLLPSERIGFARGSVSRVGLLGGMIMSLCGAKDRPAWFVPYGDEEALPIVTGGEIITDWVVHSGTAGVDAIYKRNMAFDTDVYQSDIRLLKVANVAAIDAPGKSTYTGGVLYFRPLSNENPNLGQIELAWCDNPFRVNYIDQAESGHIRLAGLDIRKSRQTALTIQPVSGASAITSVGGIHVVGCRVGQAGYDMVSSTLAADGMLVYGMSDTVRATDCYIAGNESYDCINNAYEIGAMDGMVMESNWGHDVGGNSIVEVWYSCSNLRVRYNKGERAGLVTRLNGENSGAAAYHGGGIWQALFTNFAGTTKSHAAMSNNQYYGNIIGDSRQQGIDIYGGTGTKVLHNTVYNKPDTVTNRLLNMFTNANAAGTCDAEVSNNVFVIGDNGNRKVVDLICGASVTNAQGFAITATLTGDNNIYLNQHSPSQSLVLKTPAGQIDLGASTGFGTYKAALVTAGSTFDQNSTAPFAPTGVSNFADAYISSNYKPTSAINTAGKTGYTALTRYNDGLPYDPTSCAIGALGA